MLQWKGKHWTSYFSANWRYRLSAIVQTDSLPSIMCITDTEPVHGASRYVMVPWGTTLKQFYEKAPSLNRNYGKFPIASKK